MDYLKFMKTDDKARWKYLTTDFKKHPKWKKRRLVRILMNLTILAGPLLCIKLEMEEKSS